nr:hypothetical protein [Mycolicibacterium vanbaalenii]
MSPNGAQKDDVVSIEDAELNCVTRVFEDFDKVGQELCSQRAVLVFDRAASQGLESAADAVAASDTFHHVGAFENGELPERRRFGQPRSSRQLADSDNAAGPMIERRQ